jgi:NAD(P)-dependent dehydrogenase (short-subunit alcohol dehydrogenase family)
MDVDLNGKVAVITGASKGIGKVIALAYAQAGAKVVVSSRKQEAVDLVAQEIQAAGGEAMALAAHTGRPEEVEALVAKTVDCWSRVDIAVNNAATNPHFGPLLAADEGQLEKILDTNLKGYFRLCKGVVPHMEAGGGGKIVNIASVAGLRPGLNMGAYSLSKAAVLMLTQVLAIELGSANIQVNAIAPGIIKTKFSRVLWESDDILRMVEARTPLMRIGQPEDVVGAALFLVSNASDYITGAVIVVDGGASLPSGI